MEFMKSVGVGSIAELRKIPAEQLQAHMMEHGFHFGLIRDNYVLYDDPSKTCLLYTSRCV